MKDSLGYGVHFKMLIKNMLKSCCLVNEYGNFCDVYSFAILSDPSKGSDPATVATIQNLYCTGSIIS
jgi:hypothetical protein